MRKRLHRLGAPISSGYDITEEEIHDILRGDNEVERAWVITRILRAMQQYEAALMEQQRRLKELIDCKLAGELSKEEEAELQQLRAAIERPFASAEIEQERRWDEELQRREEQLERLAVG